MNWNGQREHLDYMIRRLTEPNNTRAAQGEYNGKRRNLVRQSLITRPVYLPLQFAMTAAGQIAPYRAITTALAYDVIITGFKADTQTREIIVRRSDNEQPLVYVGQEQNLHLRLDEIAGQSADAGGGQLGVFYFPVPVTIPAGQRVIVEMFKSDATADPETANIVLVGVRAFQQSYEGEILDRAEAARVETLIQTRDTPRTVFLKQRVEFDSAVAGGLARNLLTPEVEEPLLIRGVRTNLRRSMIECGVRGEPVWTVAPTPIWGVAGEDEMSHENYQWFSRPIFLHSNSSIEVFRIENSIDGSTLDAQNGNSITWICQTV